MRTVTQCIDRPDVEPSQRRHALGRHAAQVAGIGKGAEPKAQGGNVAMLLQNGEGRDRAPFPFDGYRLPGVIRRSVTIGGYSLPGGLSKQ